MSRLRTETTKIQVVDLEPGLTIPLGLLKALYDDENGVAISDPALRGRLLEGFYITWLGKFNTGTMKLHAIALEIEKVTGD